MNLGNVLRKWRAMMELDVKGAAAELGITTRQLNRLEQGEEVGSEVIGPVLSWLLRSRSLPGAPPAVETPQQTMELEAAKDSE